MLRHPRHSRPRPCLDMRTRMAAAARPRRQVSLQEVAAAEVATRLCTTHTEAAHLLDRQAAAGWEADCVAASMHQRL